MQPAVFTSQVVNLRTKELINAGTDRRGVCGELKKKRKTEKFCSLPFLG